MNQKKKKTVNQQPNQRTHIVKQNVANVKLGLSGSIDGDDDQSWLKQISDLI